MHTLSVWCGTIQYHLFFVNAKAAQAQISKITDGEKDDPTQRVELSDDFSQHVSLKPKDVASYIIIDKEREAEIMIQTKLRETKTNIEMNGRIAGNAELQALAKRAQLAASVSQGNG